LIRARYPEPFKDTTASNSSAYSKISCEGSNSAAIVFKEAMENILNSDQSVKLLAKK
jgi:hypothetical protein